jgi:hypothetical protein
MSSVVDGYWYSYAVNAHAGNPTGPGGPQSNVVVATPRWAGSAWQACSSSIAVANYPTASISGTPVVPGHNCPSQYASSNLNAVVFGTNNTGSISYPGWPIRWFLAVGNGGNMYASSVGVLGSNIPTTPVTNNGSYNVTSARQGLGNWFSITSNNSSASSCTGGYNLNGAAYGWNTFVVVGDHGTICFSSTSTIQNTTPTGLVATDDPTTANWYKPDYYYSTYSLNSSQTTYQNLALPTYNLKAIATNQAAWNALGGSFVAVGDHGTILFSADGKTWSNTAMATSSLGASTANFTTPYVATTNQLNAVAYNSCSYTAVSGNGTAPWTWIAVGDAGSMMVNYDAGGATNWYTATSGGIVSIPTTSSSLRGIACSPNSTPGYGAVGAPVLVPLWVVVGDGGLVWISYDGLSWSVPTAASVTSSTNTTTGFKFPGFSVDGTSATVFPESMTSITYGTRFVATGASGKIYVSANGLTWNSTAAAIPMNPTCVGSAADPFCLNAQQNPINSTNTALDTATYAVGSGVGVALNAVAHVPSPLIPAGNYGSVPFGYIAVGAGGAVTFSQ